MSPVRHRAGRAFALVPALALSVALAACGDDEPEGSDAAETVTVQESATPTETAAPTEPDPTTTSAAGTPAAPSGKCKTAPPRGDLVTPAGQVTYPTGAGGLTIELSDGTTGCVAFEATDAEAGEWDPDSTELEIEMGSTAAGLYLTLSDYSDDEVDDIAANEGEPFTGIQYDGWYWVDSFHTACTVDLLAFDETSSAGTFECGSDLAPWTGGPWNATETEVTIVSASGWWATGA